MRKGAGFTLIELMIVVVVIAILMAIVLPIYQGYAVKAQLAAALADIAPGKLMVEQAMTDGKDVSAVTPADIGLRVTPHCSALIAEFDVAGVGGLTCTVAGSAMVDGKDLTLRRDENGAWRCDGSAFNANYRPVGCE